MLKLSQLSRGRISRNLLRLRFGGSPSQAFLRWYSVKPPVYNKSRNILISALNYVKDVEEYQAQVSNSASDKALAKELLQRIDRLPELLFLVSLFHSELAKVGITATSSRDFTTAQVWKYRALYITKLAQIHNIFWTQCQYLDISERDHRIGFSPSSIGILDPANFGEDAYKQLQSGVYNGTNFKEVEMAGFGKFK